MQKSPAPHQHIIKPHPPATCQNLCTKKSSTSTSSQLICKNHQHHTSTSSNRIHQPHALQKKHQHQHVITTHMQNTSTSSNRIHQPHTKTYTKNISTSTSSQLICKTCQHHTSTSSNRIHQPHAKTYTKKKKHQHQHVITTHIQKSSQPTTKSHITYKTPYLK